jgi:hypothetical protein
MTMITLGLAGAIGHDPAAALFVDGKLLERAVELIEQHVQRRQSAGIDR